MLGVILIRENGVSIENNIVLYTILCYLITWSYFIPKILLDKNLISFNIHPYMKVIAAYGPALAAVIVILINNGLYGLKRLYHRILVWDVDLKWYIVALFLQPIIWISAIGFNIFIDIDLSLSNMLKLNSIDSSTNNMFTLPIFIFFIFIQFINLLGEEIGWRGYMLYKLLDKCNWIYSSILLGLVWIVWHLPLFFIASSNQYKIPLGLFCFDLLASSFIFTWIYHYTRGSVLIACLFHTSISMSTVVLPILPFVVGNNRPYMIGILIKLIFVSCLVAKYRGTIEVEYSGKEGRGIRKIANFLNTLLSFFEKIVENIYKN